MSALDRIERRDRVPAIVVRTAAGDLAVLNGRGPLLGVIRDAPATDGLGAMRGLSVAVSFSALLVTAVVLGWHLFHAHP